MTRIHAKLANAPENHRKLLLQNKSLLSDTDREKVKKIENFMSQVDRQGKTAQQITEFCNLNSFKIDYNPITFKLRKILHKGNGNQNGPEFSVVYPEDKPKRKFILYHGKNFLLGVGGFGKVKVVQDFDSNKTFAVKIQGLEGPKPIQIQPANILGVRTELMQLLALLALSMAVPAIWAGLFGVLLVSKKLLPASDFDAYLNANKDLLANEPIFVNEAESLDYFKRLEGVLTRWERNKNYIFQDLCYESLSAENINELSDAQIIQFMCLAARELQNLHYYNRIHRDIKFDNYVFDNDLAKCKLVDFAFMAKVNGDDARSFNEAVFTPGFAAPEVFGGVYSKRSDIYAFGAMLQMASQWRPSLKKFFGQFENEFLADFNFRARSLDSFISAMKKHLPLLQVVAPKKPITFIAPMPTRILAPAGAPPAQPQKIKKKLFV
jgi:serine/threonine protein kinase